jgi:flavin reductase (DIM6/NTAB) family NADH-FMN oxidoreductase RutF
VTGNFTGLPLIEGATAHAECRIHDKIIEGDHTILIGEVLWATSNELEPLLHFNRQFGRFEPDEA